MQEQMGNVSKEVEIPGNDGKEMLEIQDIGTKIKNAFDRLINRLDTVEARISEFEGISIETSKAEKQRGQRWRKKTTMQEM